MTHAEGKIQELMVRNANETTSRILRAFADKTTITIPEDAPVSQDYRDGVQAGVDAVLRSLRELADGLGK